MANTFKINNDLFKKGLNLLSEQVNGKKKVLGIVLLNEEADSGGQLGELNGCLAYSHNGEKWADITVTINDEVNASSASFSEIYAGQTTVITTGLSSPSNTARFFSVIDVRNSSNEPDELLSNFSDSNSKVIMIFDLFNSLTLNDGSKFNFSQLEVRISL